jgi:hypothetical protein
MLVSVLPPRAAGPVEGQSRQARHLHLIRVDDADGGLTLTDAHDTEVGELIWSAKTWMLGEGCFLRETLRPGTRVVDVDADMAILPRTDEEVMTRRGVSA